jgi:uncharacterized protein involved in exopolysaccharide biosynthesis
MHTSTARRTTQKESEELSLRALAAPLFRRGRILLAAALCGFGVLLPVGLHFLYKFRSNMAVLVNRERVDSPVTSGVPNQTITEPIEVGEEEINSEAELLLSEDLLEKVVVANRLQDREPGWLDAILPGREKSYWVARAVKALARKLKVRPSTRANLIDVSYSSDDPRLSYAVLDSLATFYMEKHAVVHRPPGSYDFFAGEAERYKKALDESENRLREFLRSPDSQAPDLERTDLDLQLANSIGQLHTTEQAVAADEKRMASDGEQMRVTPQRSTALVASSPPDLLLQQLGASVLAAETKRTQLLLKYDPGYPLVEEADQELAEARAAFEKAENTKYVTENTNADPTYELLREDLAKTQADLAAQQASLAANMASIRSMQSQMTALGERNLDQADLVREQKANEENYLLYLSKREQARTSDALDKTKIENVAIAIPPSIPVLPILSPLAVILLSLAVAGMVAMGAAYTVDSLDSSFHSPAEVMETLGIPVVVAMPKRKNA